MIHNAIDTALYERAVPADLGLPSGAVAVGFVGRLVTEKGLSDLAEAWHRIAAEIPEAHLLVAGMGSGEAELRARLDGVLRVHWLGFRRDVPELVKAFDVLVVPSWCEPFGLVAVEAMAAGTPVVATRAGGLAEVLVDGIHGYFVPPRDPAALAQRVMDLVRDSERRRRMGVAGVARARVHFSIERMIDEYERVPRGPACSEPAGQ